VRPFELSTIGGPWAKRLAPRRAWIDELPWTEALPTGDAALAARLVWTRTSFSEYASAAAFAEIAAALLRIAAPIDLVAAAGDFVIEELTHAEVAARLAIALGGAVPLEVDLDKLVRPPSPASPSLVRAAELIVRTCCVGESLTVPMLKLSRYLAGSVLVASAIHKIVSDESGHAQLGWWFLDWADDKLRDSEREHLGRIAGDAIAAFAPLMEIEYEGSGLGVVACARYAPAFVEAVHGQVVAPLVERGISIPDEALAAFRA
jgi:hypothetical protein